MLYNPDLSPEENRRRIRERELTFDADSLTGPNAVASRGWRDLTPDELFRLMKINRILTKIEHEFLEQARDLYFALEPTLQKHSPDSYHNVNFKLEVIYCLREDDPEFKPGDDRCLTENCVYIQEQYLSAHDVDVHPRGDKRLIATGYDWSEVCPFDNGEPQCWLFHDLWDHSGLNWEDLLRIGGVYAELNIIDLNCLDLRWQVNL